jgi:hypothetical protein
MPQVNLDSLVAYRENDPLDPIPLDFLSTDRIRSSDGNYDVVLLPQGSVLYRGIDGKDCLKSAATTQTDSYGKWYGSISTASHYAEQNDKDNHVVDHADKSAVCAVRLKKLCRLLNMSDPETRTLIIQRLALRDQQLKQQGVKPYVYRKKQTSLQQLYSMAFGFKNTYPQRLMQQQKKRSSYYSVDQFLVMEIMKLFPKVDGYIYIMKSTYSDLRVVLSCLMKKVRRNYSVCV